MRSPGTDAQPLRQSDITHALEGLQGGNDFQVHVSLVPRNATEMRPKILRTKAH